MRRVATGHQPRAALVRMLHAGAQARVVQPGERHFDQRIARCRMFEQPRQQVARAQRQQQLG